MKSILWQNTRKPFLPFLHKSQKLFTGLDSTRPGKDTDLIFPKNSPSNEPAFLMNTNNHLCLTSVFVVSCTLLSSCSTTGDPTQGGIFWSPDKAMERRQSLLSEQSVKQATYNKIKKTTSSYANTRDDILKKRNELQARKEASSSLQDKESINAAIKDIEAELGNM